MTEKSFLLKCILLVTISPNGSHTMTSINLAYARYVAEDKVFRHQETQPMAIGSIWSWIVTQTDYYESNLASFSNSHPWSVHIALGSWALVFRTQLTTEILRFSDANHSPFHPFTTLLLLFHRSRGSLNRLRVIDIIYTHSSSFSSKPLPCLNCPQCGPLGAIARYLVRPMIWLRPPLSPTPSSSARLPIIFRLDARA